MITGCVEIDLTKDPVSGDMADYGADRRALAILEHVPDGARVVVHIGKRRYVSQDAAMWLHEHDNRLIVEVVGADPTAVMAFVRAGRAGEWPVVA